MKFPEKIDLHMHTTASDGTDSPAEIIEQVRKAGIDLFSVTDHDGIAGASEIKQILENDPADDLQFINGIEFSCRDDKGKYHILGYHYNERNPQLRSLVNRAHENRMKKLQERLDYIREDFGFDFKQEDLDALRRHHNPGKPHIANLMIRYGYVNTIQEAMKEYLNKKKFPNVYTRPEDAILAIRASGGIPVLAHPSYGDGDQYITGDEMDQRLKHLIKFGLQGVECFYSGFTPMLIREMLTFSETYDLDVTAGSDYHGRNKLVMLGDTNLDLVSDGPFRLRRFLQNVLGEG